MKGIGCAGVVAAALALAAPVGAGEIWRSDIYASAPPTFAYLRPPPLPESVIAFADDGDVVYGSPSPNLADQQIIRVRGDGSVRWAFALPLSESPGTVAAILADGDGGATFSHMATERIVHIAPDGSLAWSRAVPASSLVRVSANRLASAGGGRVTLLDTTSGDVVWQRTLSPPGDDSIVVDGAGNLYAGIRGAQGGASLDVLKLSPDGDALWRVAVDGTSGRVVAIDGGLLYIKGGYDLHALNTVDGTPAWSRYVGSDIAMRFSPDADSEPVIAGHAHIERLDASNGSARWNTSIADLQRLDRVGDALLAATSSALLRVDPANGTILWTVPASGGAELPMGIGPHGSEARFIARTTAAPGLAAPIDRRIDLATGATIANVDTASVAQGVSEVGRLDSQGRVVCAGVSQHPDGPRLNLRSIDGATGAAHWQNSEYIDVPGGSFAPSALQATPELAVGGDMFAISQVLDDGLRCEVNAGVARVASYSLETGSRRWQTWLRDASDRYCPLVSAPLPDAAGNVFVSVSTLVYCPESPGCQRRTLYKLAAADGTVVWRRDEAADGGMEGLVLYPKALTGVDMDIVLAGSVDGVAATAQRIAGTDGSVAWTSHEFDSLAPAEYVDRIDDGRLIVYGSDAASYRFAALDSTNGTTAWTSSAPWQPCYNSGCLAYGESFFLPGGDKLVPFQRDYAPWLKRQHNDGSGLVDEWMLGDASPILSSWVRQILRDPSGQLHVYLRRGHRFTGSVSFLAALDAEGNLLGQQAFYPYDGDALDAWSYPEPLAMPAPDRVLARTHAARPPLPTTSGVALYDTSVTAHGNLAIALSTDRAQVGADMPLAFHLHVTYTGDTPISGIRLVANLPWASGITGATCALQSGSGCVLDTRSGNLRATFDLAPGGTADVSANVRVLDAAAERPAITATTYGPIGLSEVDTIDNFARADLLQNLFLDGFDG